MAAQRSIDELKELGQGRPAPKEIAVLYHQAFADYGTLALWSSRPSPHPTLALALAITETLRVEGDLNARRLAERIEVACRAALKFAADRLI